MQQQADHDDVTRYALYAGVAVPVLYFGIQLCAAPFYPGYSFLARDASTLGSAGSSVPAIFNAGSIVTGAVTLVAALGFFRAFQRRGVSLALTWLTALALIGSAIGNVNAGLHPLPDPRHTDGLLAMLGMGLFLLPLLFPLSLWNVTALASLRRYLVANAVALLCLIPVMGGLLQRWSMMAGVDLPQLQFFLNHYQGGLQRIAAIGVFVPIGITAACLAARPRALA